MRARESVCVWISRQCRGKQINLLNSSMFRNRLNASKLKSSLAPAVLDALCVVYYTLCMYVASVLKQCAAQTNYTTIYNIIACSGSIRERKSDPWCFFTLFYFFILYIVFLFIFWVIFDLFVRCITSTREKKVCHACVYTKIHCGYYIHVYRSVMGCFFVCVYDEPCAPNVKVHFSLCVQLWSGLTMLRTEKWVFGSTQQTHQASTGMLCTNYRELHGVDRNHRVGTCSQIFSRAFPHWTLIFRPCRLLSRCFGCEMFADAFGKPL